MVDEVLPFFLGPTFHNLKIALYSSLLFIGGVIRWSHLRNATWNKGLMNATASEEQRKTTKYH